MKSIGEEIVNAIIEGGLLSASCPSAPGKTCMVVWSANVYDQLTEVVKEHQEDVERDAFQQGVEAWYDTQEGMHQECPYALHGPLRDEWYKGFNQAKSDNTDD